MLFRSREGGRSISTQAQLFAMRPTLSRTTTRGLRWPSLRYVGGVVLLAAAYYGAAKVGQTLRYTPVSAIWPPTNSHSSGFRARVVLVAAMIVQI